ncbi:MAG: hypothetical protein EYC68_21530 [Chloroflexota bacterium]|nr:MAG: hypothetical protein EYC68_21530 [Chloroflexota bacterium]
MATLQLYRLRIQPQSATLSPWHADTLFGHLCWEAFWEGGAQGLADFLAPFRTGSPPFVFSDGFPDDLFPRPLLPPQELDATDQVARERAMDRAKKTQDIQWLTQAQFESVLRGERLTADSPAPPIRELTQLTLKNQINRLTGTTGADEDDEEASGRLYPVTESAFVREGHARASAIITFYLWAQNESHLQSAVRWMNLLARGGYGKRKTVGYGRFRVLNCELFTLDVPDNANGIVTLANFVPAMSDPHHGYYRTRVKYGKLGEPATLTDVADSPFKFPLLMLAAGSTFYSNTGLGYVGRLVENIHPKNSTIVQGAFAPAIPIRLPN